MTKVLQRVPNRNQCEENVPGYKAHGIMFNGCDLCNRNLSSRMWPDKKGGNSVLGDRGKQDDCASISLLLNTWTATNSITNNDINSNDFQDCCLQLSNELYEYVSTLHPINNYS